MGEKTAVKCLILIRNVFKKEKIYNLFKKGNRYIQIYVKRVFLYIYCQS